MSQQVPDCQRCRRPVELPELQEVELWAWGERQGKLLTCLCLECRGLVEAGLYGVFVPAAGEKLDQSSRPGE